MTLKKRLPMSRRGAAFSGGSTAMILVGFLLGDGILILLGLCGVAFVILSYFLAQLSLRSVDVAVHMPKQVTAGKSFDLEVTLKNQRTWLDAFRVDVTILFFGKFPFSASSSWTAAGSASRVKPTMSIPGRGYSDVLVATLSTTFPLGLFHLQRSVEIHHPVTVTPRPIPPMEMNHDGSLHDAQPRGGVTVGQSFGEPRGIRPWQPGDAARRIHWPASSRALARGHGLRVREYDPPGFHPERCHLVFHSYATGGELLREDRFERAISLLAGALITLQTNGIPARLTADFNDWQEVSCSSRSQLFECLARLAKVQRNRGTEAHDLEYAFSAVPQEDALMLVSDMPPDSWSHLLIKHPHTLIIDIRQIRYRIKPFVHPTPSGGDASVSLHSHAS